METTELFEDQSEEGLDEMEASCILTNSPHFSQVLKQMSDDEDEKAFIGMPEKAGNTWKSMPAIKVTCFGDKPYNEEMLKTLENTSTTVQVDGTCTISERGNLTQQKNNERDSSSERENSLVHNDIDNKGRNYVKAKNVQLPRRCSKGFVISLQNPGRIITSTKMENNDSVTKTESSSQDYSTLVPDKLPSSEVKTTGKSSLSSSISCYAENVPKSPSSQRKRFSVGAFPGDNKNSDELKNTEIKNRRLSSGVASNGFGSPKLNDREQVTANVRNKCEKIDLSLKIDSTNDGQTNQLRRRSFTYGSQTQNQRISSIIEKSSPSDDKPLRRKFFEQQITSDELSRPSDEDPRIFKRRMSGNVGTFLGEVMQTRELNKSPGIGISERRLPLANNGKAAPGTAPGSSALNLQRVKSSPVSDTGETRQLSRKSPSDVTQRLNLFPSRACRVGISKPLPLKNSCHLDFSTNQSLSKYETDIHSISADHGDLEKAKRISIPTPPRERRQLSDTNSGEGRKSLSVGGKLSSSKLETDLGKLVSDEERVDTKRASMSSPLRTRKVSSPKPPPDMTGVVSSPLSPRLERKIYLAAAKAEARLPARGKSRSELQASSQFIIDQAEKELDKLSESLPHISMEEVMKSWHTDHRHWNVVSSLVNPNSEHNASTTNMDSVKNCRYIRKCSSRMKKLSN